MDPKSTTDADNPSDDASKSTTVTDPAASTDSKTAEDVTKTGDEKGDNLDPSKSDDTSSTDDDKKSEDDTKTSDKDDDSASTPKFDDDLDDWIEKRGLAKAETDEQKQSYQDLRNSQREYTREQQAKREAADAKALGEEVHKAKTDASEDEDDDDLDPVEKLDRKFEAERTTRLQSEFYMTNQVTEEQHKAILDVYREKTSRPTSPEAKKAAVDYWSSVDALPDLLDLAKARLVKAPDTAAISEEAARKERERIAKESESKSPGRNATTTTTTDKSEDEARTERFKNRFKS
jgi:hypothetical protein